MRSWRGLGSTAAVLGPLAAVAACGVPNVGFVATDASVTDAMLGPDVPGPVDAADDAEDAEDAGIDAADAGTKPKKDAGAGGDDASSGASDAGCPTLPPAGYAVCCGAIACGQMCKASDCNKCSACAATDVCCIHGNAATCLDAGPCP